jgi:hypothetical protein
VDPQAAVAFVQSSAVISQDLRARLLK